MSSQDMISENSDGGGSSSLTYQPVPRKKRQRGQSSLWTTKENNSLVYEVKKYESIWNPMHVAYKNGILKKTLWKRIQATDSLLMRSARNCCDRWGVLRTAFKRKLRERSQRGEEIVLPEPYCHMMFIISAEEMSKLLVDKADNILSDSSDQVAELRNAMDLTEILPGPSTRSSFLQVKVPSPPRAKKRRNDTPPNVSQSGYSQRDVLLKEAMKTLRESDEWSEHFAVSASIIRKAVTEFPDMERKFRREIMQFNLKLDTLFEERQAQLSEVKVEFDI